MSPLLNYTTKISSDRTILEIERTLANHGARAFLKEVGEDGFASALAFKVKTPYGDLAFRLPVDIGATLRVLEEQSRAGKLRHYYVNEAQARRVAWRIIKAWIEAQMALLETEMVRMEQIFLPYMVTPSGKTLYEGMVDARFMLKGGEE